MSAQIPSSRPDDTAPDTVSGKFPEHAQFPVVHLLQEVTISASGPGAEESSGQSVERDAEEIALLNPQTSADALFSTGMVSVQKSQYGGGSPVLRGFEANKVLLMADGVRMNNAIYRGGHLQNIISIDPALIERAEVLFGPSSVMYGSDALGGVMHFRTLSPRFGDTGLASTARVFMRYASAGRGQTLHADFTAGGRRVASLTGITSSAFGDLRMGRTRPHGERDWGKVYTYATRINGRDTIVPNEDPDVQIPTGFRQLHLSQKVLIATGDSAQLLLALHYSTTSDVPRFDQLNDTMNGKPLFAQWEYGPQEWLMTSAEWKWNKKKALCDSGNAILAWQRVHETRITRPFAGDSRTVRREEVDLFSANANFSKGFDTLHFLTYGSEITYQLAGSSAFAEDILTGARTSASTRYPDGGSTLQSFAAYMHYRWIQHRKLHFTAGIRYNLFSLHSLFNDTLTYDFPVKSLRLNNNALSGSIGMLYMPARTWRFNAALSTGYRTPNVDDVGKVYAKGEYVTVPNAALKPEYAYNAEVSASKKLLSGRLSLQATAYHTWLVDAIVQRDTAFNGSYYLLYDGKFYRVRSNVNSGNGRIAGGYAGFSALLLQNLFLESHLNYTYGRDLTDSVPPAHIPPLFGITSLTWESSGLRDPLTIRLYAHYNGWKRISEYSPAGEDNPEEATANGTPPWYTLNIAATYKWRSLFKNAFFENAGGRALFLQAAMENILDHHYKTFASGISAPGRNLILTLRAVF